MATRLGRNQKWIVNPKYRPQMHELFCEVLGADPTEAAPGVEVYRLGNGEQIGVFYQDDALDEAAQRRGAWLELLVDDPVVTAGQLDGLGLQRIDYFDKEHVYFQAPGGPIFRLAR